MTHEVRLTAVYEEVDEGWVQARIEEMPEVITAAPSLVAAKAALLDALGEYLLSLGDGVDGGGAGPTVREPVVIQFSS